MAIWINHALVTFERNPEKSPRRYSLVFRNVATEERVKVRADRIVLAMPRRSLELLDQRSFFFDPVTNPELQTNIKTSVMEPAFKLLMGFEAPWWRTTLKADAGVSVTDLPMRQCYYFGTDPDDEHSLARDSYFWVSATVIIPVFKAGRKAQGSTTAQPSLNRMPSDHDQPSAVQKVNEAIPIEPEDQPERDQSGRR